MTGSMLTFPTHGHSDGQLHADAAVWPGGLQLAASAPVARRIHTDRAQTKNPVSVSGLDDSATRSGDFIVDTGSIQVTDSGGGGGLCLAACSVYSAVVVVLSVRCMSAECTTPTYTARRPFLALGTWRSSHVAILGVDHHVPPRTGPASMGPIRALTPGSRALVRAGSRSGGDARATQPSTTDSPSFTVFHRSSAATGHIAPASAFGLRLAFELSGINMVVVQQTRPQSPQSPQKHGLPLSRLALITQRVPGGWG